MYKFIKKALCVSLCLFMILGLFGCGKTQKQTEGETLPPEISEMESEIKEQQADVSKMDFEFTAREKNVSYEGEKSVNITFSDKGADISGAGAVYSNGCVTLQSEGTYILSGKSDSCKVIVDTGDNDKIRIVLSDISLKSDEGAVLYIKNADKVFVTLAPGTQNTLRGGDEYTDGETNVDGAVYSKADLCFNGSGELSVTGVKHGIVSKDDLVITGGVYSIESQGVGLCGKDCIKIADGEFEVNAGSDGLRSDNDEDENRGYIYIENGTFDITAGNDGLQAETVLKCTGGRFDIQTGGGSVNASTDKEGNMNPNWNFGGNDFGASRPMNRRDSEYGNIAYKSSSYGEVSAVNTGYTASGTSSSQESAKGIKAGCDILISGGEFNIDSADDAVHSNGTVEISGGVFTISSGDDGVHSDTALVVSGGDFDIKKSYEGIESADILIKGGNITLVASDDGLNAAGGNDSSSLGGRPGAGSFSSERGRIAIAGGRLNVDASGDGIDSNGTLTVSGGITLVGGPQNSGNGALDYDSSATITGGIFIALGASGMAQGFSSAQNQCAIAVNITSQSKNTSFAVCDGDGNVLISFTPEKSYSHAVFSCPAMQTGNTYTVYCGGSVDGADKFGFAENSSLSGGTKIGEYKPTSNIYGSSGGGMNPGGMGGGGRPR